MQYVYMAARTSDTLKGINGVLQDSTAIDVGQEVTRLTSSLECQVHLGRLALRRLIAL